MPGLWTGLTGICGPYDTGACGKRGGIERDSLHRRLMICVRRHALSHFPLYIHPGLCYTECAVFFPVHAGTGFIHVHPAGAGSSAACSGFLNLELSPAGTGGP